MSTHLPGNMLAPVLSFKARDVARFTHTVYQSDFQEIALLRAECRKAKKQLEDAEERVKTALKSGARIEPGALSPQLLEFQRCGYTVAPGTIEKLIIE